MAEPKTQHSEPADAPNNLMGTIRDWHDNLAKVCPSGHVRWIAGMRRLESSLQGVPLRAVASVFVRTLWRWFVCGG